MNKETGRIVTELIGSTAYITHGEVDVAEYVRSLDLTQYTCNPNIHSQWYLGASGRITTVFLDDSGELVAAVKLYAARADNPTPVCGIVNPGTMAIVHVKHLTII